MIDNLNFRKKLYNFSGFDTNVQYLVIKANNDWLEPLSKNKIASQRLKKLGYDINKFKIQFMFKKWYNTLFKLSESLEAKYENFIKIAKLNHSKLICAQIRIGGRRKHVAFDAFFTKIENTKYYWDYIRSYFIKNDTNYKLFVTSDSKHAVLEAAKIFGLKHVVANNGLYLHLDREKTGRSYELVEKIYLDFHCLQNCDMAIISESGFGKLGLLNRNDPNKNLVMFTKKQKYEIKKNANDLSII